MLRIANNNNCRRHHCEYPHPSPPLAVNMDPRAINAFHLRTVSGLWQQGVVESGDPPGPSCRKVVRIVMRPQLLSLV